MLQVNGAVDAMDGERNALQTEMESYQQQLSAALDDLEEEKARSQELEQKLLAHGVKVRSFALNIATSVHYVVNWIFYYIIITGEGFLHLLELCYFLCPCMQLLHSRLCRF